MNVSSPKKSRVPHTKDNQPKGIPILPTQPIIVNNAIPKQHVGAGKNNQLEFDPEVGRIFSPTNNQGYISQISPDPIQTNAFYTDQNPFDLLPADLFDVSLSEDDILNQPETNKEPVVNKPIEEVPKVVPEKVYQPQISNQYPQETTEDEYEESSIQDESNTSAYPHNRIRPSANHPLMPIVEKWLEQNNFKGPTLAKNRSKINKFIKFLISKKIDAPTQEHILQYNKALLNDSRFKSPRIYISTIRTFFRWTEEANLYKNITLGTEKKTHTQERYISLNEQLVRQIKLNSENTPQQIANIRQHATVTIRDMENAKFFQNQAVYLLDNDLIIFRQWIETLDAPSVDAQRKVVLLKFAHFLHFENRTTPTQQDIIDYYRRYLFYRDPTTVNKVMVTIRRFFAWTNENGIYPNIAINICPVSRKPMNVNDLPLLQPDQKMKPIPEPTKPLINKTI